MTTIQGETIKEHFLSFPPSILTLMTVPRRRPTYDRDRGQLVKKAMEKADLVV